jgi:hypothetical protein
MRTASVRYGRYGSVEGSSAAGGGHMEAFSHDGPGCPRREFPLVPRWRALFTTVGPGREI